MNIVRTVFLMTLMMGLFLFVGYLIGGKEGMTIAFFFSLIMNFGSYWFSDKIVLAMYKAKEVSRESVPNLYNLVEELTKNANLPMPRVYLINNDTPNAFATGRNPKNAAVAFTTGILKMLNNKEIAGVVAHELAHIKNKDILLATITATLVGTITYIAHMASWAMIFGRGGGDRRDNGLAALFMIIVAPIAATLIQLAISRAREYYADETGAKIAADPMGLASALKKLTMANQNKPIQNAKPASAHMFIVNPLSGQSFAKMFSTHPPLEERIKRLELIAAGRR